MGHFWQKWMSRLSLSKKLESCMPQKRQESAISSFSKLNKFHNPAHHDPNSIHPQKKFRMKLRPNWFMQTSWQNKTLSPKLSHPHALIHNKNSSHTQIHPNPPMYIIVRKWIENWYIVHHMQTNWKWQNAIPTKGFLLCALSCCIMYYRIQD